MSQYKVTLSFEVIVTCYDKSEAERLAIDAVMIEGANSPIYCDSIEDISEMGQ